MQVAFSRLFLNSLFTLGQMYHFVHILSLAGSYTIDEGVSYS